MLQTAALATVVADVVLIARSCHHVATTGDIQTVNTMFWTSAMGQACFGLFFPFSPVPSMKTNKCEPYSGLMFISEVPVGVCWTK